jgi:profilin
MSWQPYVDTSLVGSGKIVAGAIVGHDGSVWAASPSIASKVTAEETKKLVTAFGDPNGIRSEGFRVAGTKYITIMSTDREIYGKSGASGICCCKTKQAVVVGLYDEKTVSGEAAKIVGALGDYLISVNY